MLSCIFRTAPYTYMAYNTYRRPSRVKYHCLMRSFVSPYGLRGRPLSNREYSLVYQTTLTYLAFCMRTHDTRRIVHIRIYAGLKQRIRELEALIDNDLHAATGELEALKKLRTLSPDNTKDLVDKMKEEVINHFENSKMELKKELNR